MVLGTDSQTERAVTAARLLSEGFARPGGADLDALVRPAGTVGPVDLRNTMCSEKARKARYDPAPETAVIDSPYLSPRRPRGEPVAIALGGIDAPPAPAVLAEAFRPSRIPVPVRRPSYEPVDVDGVGLTNIPVRGTIPVPSASPLRTP